MTVAEQATSFVSALFATAPTDALVEIRSVSSNGPSSSTFVEPGDDSYPTLEHLKEPSTDWYFGIGIRNRRKDLVGCSFVWADLDGKSPDQVHAAGPLLPEPSLVVSSGHGTHIYWVLRHMIEPERAARLAQLAALALDGDRSVPEPRRVMRLPGSTNRKRGDGVACEVVQDSTARYDPSHLEEWLLARYAYRFWEEGRRNAILLGLSATTARAGWTDERLESCVRAVCSMRGDTEVSNRVFSAIETLRKHSAGMAVSAQALREAAGSDFKPLIESLGITDHDGDVLKDGELIGHTVSLERDLVRHFAALSTWAFSDGVVQRWLANRWVPSTEPELRSFIFHEMSSMRVILSGDEQDLPVTARLAASVTSIVVGSLATTPLPPMRPSLLPLSNGVLDLDTLELLPHAPANANRWLLPDAYDPDATCPSWTQFLEEAAGEDAEWLREWVGYCLRDGNHRERMAWLYGPTGTGKSTFIKTLNRMFGDAAAAVPVDRMNEYAVAALAGKRLAVCTEISNSLLRTVTLKQLVSGDPTPARHPYGRPFDMEFTGKFMFASNVLPPVDQGEGLWRRLVIVAFRNQPSAPDPTLGDRLAAEIPGILNWAVVGMQRLAGYGREWLVPSHIQSSVEEYRDSADLFTQFFQEEMVVDPDAEVLAKEVYVRYIFWMKEHGHTPEPMGPIFWSALRDLGLVACPPRRVAGRLVRSWRGASLVADAFSSREE